MKSFKNYADLKKYICAVGMMSQYAEDELYSYLSCIGSNVGSFKLDIDGKNYEITVKSKCINEEYGDYEDTYIILNED